MKISLPVKLALMAIASLFSAVSHSDQNFAGSPQIKKELNSIVEREVSFCGDSAVWSRDGQIYQAKDWKIEVTPGSVSKAGALNGVTWIGLIAFKADVYRKLSTRGDGWLDWVDNDVEVMFLRPVTIRNGKQDEIEEHIKPVDCSVIQSGVDPSRVNVRNAAQGTSGFTGGVAGGEEVRKYAESAINFYYQFITPHLKDWDTPSVTGSVTISADLARDGTLYSCAIKSPSHYNMIDIDALSFCKTLPAFKQFPDSISPEIKGIAIQMPMEYK